MKSYDLSGPLLGALLLLGISALPGCVYRLDTQQGNLLDVEQVEAVEVGMTRSQVRFLLGTPMVADPFSSDRWDYIYTFRQGKSGDTRRSHLIVWFDGDVVNRIELPEPFLDLPGGS